MVTPRSMSFPAGRLTPRSWGRRQLNWYTLGGHTDQTTIWGGRLVLENGLAATSGIDFANVTSGSLWIYGTTMPTSVITGLVRGDTLDLRDVTYSNGTG